MFDAILVKLKTAIDSHDVTFNLYDFFFFDLSESELLYLISSGYYDELLNKSERKSMVDLFEFILLEVEEFEEIETANGVEAWGEHLYQKLLHIYLARLGLIYIENYQEDEWRIKTTDKGKQAISDYRAWRNSEMNRIGAELQIL